MPAFTIDVHPWDSGGSRVVASGELDLAVAGHFCETVARQLATGDVLLDLRELEFMDSSGIRALDALLRSSAEQGTTLQVCEELRRPVRQVLAMTGMLDVLALVPDETS